MSGNPNPRPQVTSLSVGNVVSTGIVLYRSHLKSYLGISLIAHLWIIPIYLGIILFAGILIFAISQKSGIIPLIILLGIVGEIFLLLYCMGKYLTNSALISRLSFLELVNKLESIPQARRFLQPRQWSFVRVGLRIGLYLFLTYIGLAITFFITVVIITGILGLLITALNNQILSVILSVIIFIIYIAALLLFIFGFFWFASRWLIAEVPLAVEENINGGQSIQRSWLLTQNFVIRIQLIVMVAFLVTIPFLVTTSYFPQIILLRVEPLSPLYWLIYSLSLLSSLLGGIFVLPFWQSIKAVLYYDLRSRKEGLGLEIRDASPEDREYPL